MKLRRAHFHTFLHPAFKKKKKSGFSPWFLILVASLAAWLAKKKKKYEYGDQFILLFNVDCVLPVDGDIDQCNSLLLLWDSLSK